MYRYCRRLVLGTLLIVVLIAPVGAETLSRDQLDNKASSYLELLDQGHYEEAWQDMSALFQALNNQSQWQNRQQTIRTAYGALSSRQLRHITYRQSYTLSPDGQYVIVQFKSSYQNKADTTETVVLDCHSTPECSIREYIIR